MSTGKWQEFNRPPKVYLDDYPTIPAPLTQQGNAQFMAMVDNVVEISKRTRRSSVEGEDGWLIIVFVRAYLAESMLENGAVAPDYAERVEAYHDLAARQSCLWDGTIQICKQCGQMKGLHRQINEEFTCRVHKDKWTNPTRVISNRFEE